MNRSGRLWLLLGALLVLGAGAFVALQLRSRAEAAEALDRTLEDVDRVLGAGADRSELSGLFVRLQALQAGDDERVLVALARIELARGRHEAAASLLAARVQSGSATAPALHAAAAAWLLRQAFGGKDAADRRRLGQQALEYAERAEALTGAAGDLFLAWQAAVRLADAEAVQQHAAALQERHAGTLEARTVQALRAPALPAVEALAAEWAAPPAEVRLALGLLLLDGKEVERALVVLDELLLVAPNLLEVRNAVATAHFVAAATLPMDDAARARHRGVCNEQVLWLDANAPAGDARRAQWMQMLEKR
jgi:hypothetical protein